MATVEVIPNVLFDANVFIDLVKYGGSATKPTDERRRQHVEVAEMMLRSAKAGRMKVFASAICIAECVKLKDETNGESILTEEIKRLFSGLLLSGTSGVTLRQPDPRLLIFARDLTWKHGLSIAGADAVHVATAKETNCAALITFDGKIANKKANIAALKKLGIRVCKADEAIDLVPSDDKQGEFSASQDAQFTKPRAPATKKPRTRKRPAK